MYQTDKLNSEYAIELTDVCKKYRDFSLKNVSFKVPTGTIMGFVGENGAGKTTTIKSILEVRQIDSGTIKIFGQDKNEASKKIHDSIGIVLDDCAFSDTLKPKEISIILKHIFSEWDEQQYYSYLDRFSLPKDKKIKEYSRGMKMKLSIATALSHKAKLLIMDEPTGGLDPVVRDEILDIFMDYMQDDTNSILLSSHILTDIERVADYVTFIHKGEIVFSESREELSDRYIVAHCGSEEVSKIDPKLIAGMRKGKFGCEVLINDKQTFLGNSYGMETEKALLEDIMLFTIKGEADTFRE